MKNYISVCKNVIAENNKKKWKHPKPPIRISQRPSGPAVAHGFSVGILDKDGTIVAKLQTTKDGKPLLKCGAKVMLATEFPTTVLA